MRKFICAFLVMMSAVFPVRAAEEFADSEVFASVYTYVQDKYIEPLPASEVAVNVIKGLNKVDRRLKIADDNKRVSLYYNGRIIKSFLKPENPKDIHAAVKLTGRMIKAAQQVSKTAADKDFEITDIILEDGINSYLDGDSKYYPTFSAEKKGQLKNRRNFAARMMGNILYLKIRAFNKFTLESFNDAFAENPDFAGVILDLRSSPGGSLAEALTIADKFLDGGIVISAKGRDPSSQQFYNSTAGDIAGDKPMVVLVDGETTSSAEIIAATLQEQSRAKVVGTKTFGKGTRQDLFELPNGAELGLTTAWFYTPSGRPLDKQGVNPDICTFEMLDRKNLNEIINKPKPKSEACPREPRELKNVDLDIAEALLKSRI